MIISISGPDTYRSREKLKSIQQHRLCYDCFVIAIMKRKIFFCYTCGTLCFSTLQTKHQTHNVEYNKKTLIHIAIKYYHVRKAFTLLEYDSDFDTL